MAMTDCDGELHRQQVLAALADPVDSIPSLWALVDASRKANEGIQLHMTADILLPLLIERRTDIDRAEALAKELVELSADSVHLELLAMVYVLQGKLAEAEEARARAALAPNQHADGDVQLMIDAAMQTAR